MSESTNANTAGAGEQKNDGQQQESGGQFEAITSQADLDRIISQRIARERSKFADYEDIKAKAAKFDQAQQASRTAEQQAADRIAELEAKFNEAATKAVRAEVAAEKGVPVALLNGSTREELEAAADALIAFRGEQKPAGPKPDLSQGAKGKQGAGTAADQFEQFFSQALNT